MKKIMRMTSMTTITMTTSMNSFFSLRFPGHKIQLITFFLPASALHIFVQGTGDP